MSKKITITLTEDQRDDLQTAVEVLYQEYGDEDRLKEQLKLLGVKYDIGYWC